MTQVLEKRVPSLEEIWKAQDLEFKEEPVSEWGEDFVVYVTEMDAGSSLQFSRTMDDEKNISDGMFILISFCVRDAPPPNGKLLFTMDDVPKMRGKNIRVWTRLQRAAMEVNKMTSRGLAVLKKLSSEAEIEGSPTDLQKS